MIALYEFKTGQGAHRVRHQRCRSGGGPHAVSGDVTLGRRLGHQRRARGKAQASTTASRKFHQLITATGEYSIEAWVVPGNVTQEDARIVSYSGSTTARNFTMGQTMYNYDFFGRSTATGANGTPQLSTDDDDERLQASLQHVVMTFDPVNGRRIYVNGEFTGDLDGAGGGTLGDWDNSFAFVLGNEVSNNRQWTGVVRLVAIHNRALTLQQIQQNFEAGVGEKFFLLFGVEHLTNVPQVLHHVRSRAVRQLRLPVHQSEVHQPRRRPRCRAASRSRACASASTAPSRTVGQAYRLLDTTITDAQLLGRDRPDAVDGRHDHRARAGPGRRTSSSCASISSARARTSARTYAAAVPPTFSRRAAAVGHRRAHVR